MIGLLCSMLIASPKWIDLDTDFRRQVVVDKEAEQYLGHPTTVLLEDGKTILCVFPKGHGKGAIIYKKSSDGGIHWSARQPTPASWETSLETPTIHRVIDPVTEARRLLLWSGLNPARLSVSEDDGSHWSELKPAGDWGGIVVMSSIERLTDGSYAAFFHDDGRFMNPKVKSDGVFRVFQTNSMDGGLTWTYPDQIHSSSFANPCEPGTFRSPDGKTICMLLRENTHRQYSQVMFSSDECKTWSRPHGLFPEITGDRHVAKYGKDGRLVVVFRDTMQGSPWWGNWVAWVGKYDDIVHNRPGQYRVRLKDNLVDGDCGYSGLELLPDGTFVSTTYGHWKASQQPYILSVRFKLSELDKLAKTSGQVPIGIPAEDTSHLPSM